MLAVLATALAYNVPLTASSSRVVRSPDVVARELTFTANLEVQTPYAKASGGRDSRPVHRATPASAHVRTRCLELADHLPHRNHRLESSSRVRRYIHASPGPFLSNSCGADHPLSRRMSQALSILMSQAESSRRLDAGDVPAQQRWLVVTPIQFPGMVARSETSMDIAIDEAAPRLLIRSADSNTVCEGGPSWAQALLAQINNIASTSSSNIVELRDVLPGSSSAGAAAENKLCVSVVKLAVTLTIPGLLLPPFIPAGPFEKAGSDSIQALLDRDMAPILAKFREAYLQYERTSGGA